MEICKNCYGDFEPYKTNIDCPNCFEGEVEPTSENFIDICRYCKGTGESTYIEDRFCCVECRDDYFEDNKYLFNN